MAKSCYSNIVIAILLLTANLKPAECGLFGLAAYPMCLGACEAARGLCIAAITVPSSGTAFFLAMAVCNSGHLVCVGGCSAAVASPV